jgi:hypothetical protein
VAFLQKLRTVLTESFPPPDEVKLKDPDGNGVVGVVVSTRFRRVNMRDRRRKVEKVLRENLSPEELRQVVILVPVTPEEQKDNTNWVEE